MLGALAFLIAAAVALWLPPWLVSLATIAFANALVVLGLVILWRAGLVPFGQALFYAIGAYAVALLGRYTPVRDVFVVVIAGGICAGLIAYVIGLLLARYREIFFAMLSLAMSMILYGILVKTESLGSTDGFNVEAGTFFGYRPAGAMGNLAIYWLVLGWCAAAAFLVALYFRSVAGSLGNPLRDNEIRVEFLGLSVDRLIHLKLVISGVLAGIGGALAAPRIALVPGMDATIINECFIIVIIGGLGNLWGSFLGALAFGFVVQFGTVLAPNWQDVLPYLLMLVVLIIRPWGLLGRPEAG